ncbi:ATP-sensitive inward rectifier potassium channel 12 isoform X2 [Uranotaenia lowii]|uniref:ATP-sensitive inward rectifier potassium channel 12 isoform X2 n=1 Tax=Uranotaenia lowii TaxID=190385 RepID=UPI0024785266|nr:ATP-sensitive inward rectifier potassium channel 12 isoform X2 [Uranotaenia lowii]
MSLDTLASSAGSPYAHGKQWRRQGDTVSANFAQLGDDGVENRYSRPINIINYNRQESCEMSTKPPRSPYHIRKPVAFERSRQWVEEQQKHRWHDLSPPEIDNDLAGHNDDHWKSSQESDLNSKSPHQRHRGQQHNGDDDNDDDIAYLDNALLQHQYGEQRQHNQHYSREMLGMGELHRHNLPERAAEELNHHHQPVQRFYDGRIPTTAEEGIYHDDTRWLQFPIVLQGARNMRHIRHRLRPDPEHQGTRAIRSRRLINKAGERNVLFLNLPEKSVRFVKDLVTTLVDVQWRYTLTVFMLSFFGSWLLFAILWYLIAYAHGDLNFDPETGERLGEGSQPCVEGATTFAAFLLFSIETQVSTGYGAKTPTEECPEVMFLLTVQIIVGVVIDAAMVGIVYAKLVRPPKKISDMKFSRKAVICQRDGKLCFVFRLSDIKQQHAIETKISAVMLEQRRSLEGELIEKHESYMKLENQGRILLMWPVTICHVIDRDSPLFDVSAKDLLQKKFEIVVTLTGGTMTTGQVNEARTSYLPGEIYWGHRFENIIQFDVRSERYVAANERIDAVEPVDTPLCSARRLEEVLEEVHQYMEQERERDLDGAEQNVTNGGNGYMSQESDDENAGIQLDKLSEKLKLISEEKLSPPDEGQSRPTEQKDLIQTSEL